MIKLDQVFARLEPYRVLSDLAMPISARDGCGTFEYQGEPFWFDRYKVVSCRRASKFVAGDIVDFIHHLKGAKAVDWVLHHYPLDTVVDAEILRRQLQRRRQQLHAVLSLQDNLTQHPERYPDAMLWLRQRQLNVAGLRQVIYAASSAELMELSETLDLQDLKTLPADRAWLVIPYFSDWDQVATLRLEPATVGDTRWWDIRPAAHAWGGLQHFRPGDQVPRVHSSVVDGLQQLCQSNDQQTQQAHLWVKFTPEVDRRGRQLAQLESKLTSTTGIPQLAKLAKLTQKLLVQSNGQQLDWLTVIKQQLQQSLTEGYGLAARLLVEEIKSDRTLCHQLGLWLDQQNPQWGRRFREQTQTHLRLIRGKDVITDSAAGYLISRGQEEQRMTNFRLQVDSTVWFQDNDEIWHEARVLSGDQEFALRFSRQTAGRGDLLESVAASAVLRSGKAAPTPVLFDAGHKKHLAAVVAAQIAEAPKVEGLKVLGWHGGRLTTPGWRTGPLGVETPPKFAHPANDLLKSFSFQPLPRVRTANPEDPLELLALLAGLLARGQRGALTAPQPVRRTTLGMAAMAQLAQGWGQLGVVHPKLNQRGGQRRPFDADDIQGLPLWLELTQDAADQTIYPGIYLSEQGLEITTEVVDLAAATAGMLQALASSLLLRASEHSMPAEANWQRIVFEGRTLLQQRLPGPWDQIRIPELACRTLLWRLGLDQLNQHFVLSQPGRITWNRDGMDRDLAARMLTELQQRTELVIEGLEVHLPVKVFNELVEENLGVAPTVDRLKAPLGQVRVRTV